MPRPLDAPAGSDRTLRAVIFDIDGTLYDYRSAHAVAFAALKDYAREQLTLEPERFEALHRRAEEVLAGRCGGKSAVIHNRLIRYQVMLELIGAPIAYAPAMAELYWTRLLDAMRPNPGMGECLRAIREMGLKVGVGTNMTADWQFAKLTRLDAMPFVDFMVTSEECGAEKPDRRLFELCAEKAGCAPEACAFVGDSLKGDVLGALNAGMRAVWLRPEEYREPIAPGAIPIGSLAELPAVIAAQQCEGA